MFHDLAVTSSPFKQVDSSQAHNRRFTRFVELVAENGPDAEIRDLLRTINEEQVKAVKTTEPTTSKRAAKRVRTRL